MIMACCSISYSLLPICLSPSPFAASSSHHRKLPSSKPNKPRTFASTTLMSAGIALATSALIAPWAALGAVLEEPPNALSLPTWAIHVSSVVEWVSAMVLAWDYGDRSGFEAWKGLSWGMILPLGGALCACTWHFFYDSESLEVLVAMQAGLTVIGNMTMCFAAFRIFRESQRCSKSS